MRNIIAILFITIFSTQVLPIKMIGKILAKNQLTEEVKSDDCDDTDDDIKDDTKEGKYSNIIDHMDEHAVVAEFKIVKKGIIFFIDDDLPNSHVKDIHCPPPNC